MNHCKSILRELRREVKKVGAYEIAKKTKLSPKTVYNFLRPASHPSLEACCLIASCLKMDLKVVSPRKRS